MNKIQEVMSRIFNETSKNSRNFEVIRAGWYSVASPSFMNTTQQIDHDKNLVALDIDALIRFLHDTFELDEEVYAYMLSYLSKILVRKFYLTIFRTLAI